VRAKNKESYGLNLTLSGCKKLNIGAQLKTLSYANCFLKLHGLSLVSRNRQKLVYAQRFAIT